MTIDELLSRIEMKSPPAPEDDVAGLEKRVGHSLPADYRQFLIDCNGGYLGGSLWFQGNNPDGEEVGAGIHHIAGFREESHFSITDALDTYEGRIPDDLLYIHDDPGGNAICIGLTGERKGKIYFWDHEEDDWDDDLDLGDEDSDGPMLIANSFAEYVAGLSDNTD